MKQAWAMFFGMIVLFSSLLGQAQQNATANPAAAVPTLVRFNGTLSDINGKALTGTVGVTFLLYKEERGGAPLWIETQNVTPDKSGRYSVTLGSTKSQGLPTDLFASGDARWLGAQAEGQAEQPRVLLLSVPYALKAGDAQTVGGLPASAFVLAAPAGANAAATANPAAPSGSALTPPLSSSNVTTTGGTLNTIPMFTSATNIQNAILTQTGTTAINVGGKLNLPAAGTATATAGFKSQPQDFVASVFNSGTKAAVAETFQWQAEPVGNNTTTASGTLNLLYGSGTSTPAETGLKVSSKGLFTFAAGQTFPGTGTITKVTAGTDLTGGGSSGAVTLNVDTTKIPQLSAANIFTGNQTINGILSDTVNNTTQAANITQNGSGSGIASTANNGTGVSATGNVGVSATGGPGVSIGVSANSAAGWAVYAQTTSGIAVFGTSNTPNGIGSIEGFAGSNGSGANTPGVTGFSTTQLGVGTRGIWSSASTVGAGSVGTDGGVWGDSSQGLGVIGTSDFSVGVEGVSAGSDGVLGEAQAANAAGVSGNSSSSSGFGVFGSSSGTGVFGQGVSGSSPGAFGQNGSESGTGKGFNGTFGVGVRGDGGTTSGQVGVLGTVDDGVAGYFLNSSPSGDDTLLVEALNSASAPFVALNGATGGSCNVDANGNLNCTGAKHAVVPIDGGKRIVALAAIESPKNWFEDAGSSSLINGAGIVAIDAEFTQTVNTGLEYQVFLTPYGDCRGLYVTNRTANSFEVHELGGGTANIGFGYRIMALRKNYENIRFADHTHDLDGVKRMRERARAAGQKEPVSHMPPPKNLAPLHPAIQKIAAR